MVFRMKCAMRYSPASRAFEEETEMSAMPVETALDFGKDADCGEFTANPVLGQLRSGGRRFTMAPCSAETTVND
jgi:hypothetical protein